MSHIPNDKTGFASKRNKSIVFFYNVIDCFSSWLRATPMLNKRNSDGIMPLDTDQSSFMKQMGYFLLIIPIYLILSPELFGPTTNTLGIAGDQQFLINPVLHYIHEFDKFDDPLTRIWFAEFDIHHNPHFNSRYPFFFFWLGDGGGLLAYSHRAFLVSHFHNVIGGLGAFVLARAIGARPVSAFAAGLFFAFCLNNTLHSVFFWRHAANAWIPWALAGIWWVTTGKNWKAGILVGAPAIALLVFAKCAQPLLYLVISSLLVGLAGIYYGFRRTENFKSFVKTCVLPSSTLFVLALLLALPVFLSVFLGQSEYVRWTSAGPVFGSYKVPFHATLEMSYPPKAIANLFVPLAKLPTIGSTFIGPIIGIVLFGAVKMRKLRVLTFAMIGLFIYFIINGFGEHALLPHLTYRLPMINNVRELPSHYLMVNIAAIVLFAFGWDYFLKSEKSNRWLQIVVVSCVLLTVVGLLIFQDLFEINNTYVSILLAASPLLLLFVIRQERPIVKEMLLVLLACLVVFPSSVIRGNRTFDVTKNNYYKEEVSNDVRASWKWVAGQKEHAIVAARIVKRDKARLRISSTRAASLAMYENLRPFHIAMSPRPKKEFDYSSFLAKEPNRLIDRGLEYFISNADKDFSSKRMKVVNQFGSVSVYKVVSPIQRLKPACIIHGDDPDCVQDLDVVIGSEGNTQFDYTVNLPSGQKLAFFGFNNGNWKIDINGEENPSVEWTKDHAIFALPSGTHTVSFKYEIPTLKTYWSFFKIGLFLYLVLTLFAIVSQLKSRSQIIKIDQLE